MDLNGRNMKRILLIIVISILVFVSVQHFELVISAAKWIAQLLSPFVAGLCFAFIFNVPLKFLEERCFAFAVRGGNRWWRRHHRSVCLLLTYLLIAGLLFILVFLVVPQLKNSGEVLIANMPGYLETLEAWASRWMEWFGIAPEQITALTSDWDAIFTKALEILQSFAPDMMGSAATVASGIFNGIVSLAVGLVFSAYLLAKKEDLCLSCKRTLFAFLPRDKADYLVSAGKLTNRTFARFVSGQLTEAVIIGMLCFIGMGIFRMPYASLISTVVGVTALIPIFGAFIGTAIGAFLLFMIHPMTAVWFVLFIVVLQQIESNFIYPKVVGTSVGLPGIWVLFAVMVGGNVFGIMGMLVGIPLASVAYTLFRDAVSKRLRRRNVTREDLYNAGKDNFGQ